MTVTTKAESGSGLAAGAPRRSVASRIVGRLGNGFV